MRGKVGAAAAFLSKISPRKTVLYVCSYLQGRGGLGLGIVVRSMYSLPLDPPLENEEPLNLPMISHENYRTLLRGGIHFSDNFRVIQSFLLPEKGNRN